MLCLQVLIYRSNNSLSLPRAVSWQFKNIRASIMIAGYNTLKKYSFKRLYLNLVDAYLPSLNLFEGDRLT